MKLRKKKILLLLLATVGDASQFCNGQQVAASLGLTPKQNSSNGKSKLLGMQRGVVHIQSLFSLYLSKSLALIT